MLGGMAWQAQGLKERCKAAQPWNFVRNRLRQWHAQYVYSLHTHFFISFLCPRNLYSCLLLLKCLTLSLVLKMPTSILAASYWKACKNDTPQSRNKPMTRPCEQFVAMALAVEGENEHVPHIVLTDPLYWQCI